MTIRPAPALLLAGLALFAAASPAPAADPLGPARELLSMMEANWDEDETNYIDYFDASKLDTLYAKAFADAYREAAKHPAYDDPSSGPFDYDVMTDSQDGCPIKDVVLKAGPVTDGVTDVTATFKFFACWVNDETYRDKLTTLHVLVGEEGGRAVIVDVLRDRDEGEKSLLKEMQDIAKGG